MRLRLGLIGLSSEWKSRHLPALRLLADRFEISGVYSAVTSLAENVARDFDARCFLGFREMLADPGIDAVLFLESSWYGTAPIHAACKHGKAIYCGGEVQIPPGHAAELCQLVDASGIAFMAEYPRRLAPATLRLKELIATRLGNPELIFCHRRLPQDLEALERQNRFDRELMELMDWCGFVADRPVAEVQGIQHRSARTGNVDYLSLSLRMSHAEHMRSEQPESEPKVAEIPTQATGDVIAQISCGGYIPPQWQEASNFMPPADMQVCCANGVAFLDLPNSLIWFDQAGRHQESLGAEMPVGEQLLTQFHRAVTSLVRKMADLEDVYQGLLTLQIAHQSIQQGRSLRLSCAERDRPQT